MHQAVRGELETFVADIGQSGARPLPRYVLDALRAYVRCGVLAHGFCRWRCDRCGHDLLAAFSCKQRCICPSCGVRRMDEVGAELVDRVLPDVPYRQWVLSLPWELRELCARRADVLSAVGRAFWRALRAELRVKSGALDAEPGAVTFVQRFGGSLNLNVHLHVIAPDGVFVTAERGVRFIGLGEPTGEELEHIVRRVRKSVVRWLGRKGYLHEQEPIDEQVPDALEACRKIALRYGKLVGLETPASTDRDERRFEPKSNHRCHVRTHDGFDLDARVHIAQGDDLSRERLVRYCARPAIVLERLERLPDGRYSYRTKYVRGDRTHRVMTGPELIARIAALVPPPRYPLLRYHGVFAAAHLWRQWVVPKPPPPRDTCQEPRHREAPAPPGPPPTTAATMPNENLLEPPPVQSCELRSPFVLSDPHLRRLLDGLLLMKGPHADWAMLLRRSHDIDVLDCPRCHGRLRLLAIVRDKGMARRILARLGKASEPPAFARCRDPTVDFAA